MPCDVKFFAVLIDPFIWNDFANETNVHQIYAFLKFSSTSSSGAFLANAAGGYNWTIIKFLFPWISATQKYNITLVCVAALAYKVTQILKDK